MLEPADAPSDAETIEIHRRLVAAWWSIGASGFLLLLSIAIFSGNPRHSVSAASPLLGMASLGAMVGVGGALVVRRSRRELLAAAAGRMLPIARVV